MFELVGAVDPPPELAEALARTVAERGAFGSPLFYYPVTGSTNDLAARLAEAGALEGTTVVSDAQTAGRGRLGRTWLSPPGAGLYVSVVVRAEGPAGDSVPLPAMLTLMAGVALADAVRDATGFAAELKWPNDLMVGRRKLAGILAEASAHGPAIEYVVLGFGINVCAAGYPPDVAARATSLEGELGRPVDRAMLLTGALVNLARLRQALRKGGACGMLARWRTWSPSASGAPVEWRTQEGTRRGTTAGLDDDGALRVEVDGRVDRVMAGEMVWL